MQKLPNFDFSAVKTISGMLTSLEEQVRLLATYVDDCDPLDDDDRDELLENIEWVKRFYEITERRIVDDDRE
ncbi:hypothetical protein UFOVP35_15 [uncultured Caudovirales phage]|uniref:Uncharacterized protein n=1 Tax=uncultured Caudovirales phage TaxID=2100421 RepID=A0A6J7WSW1_9CAUD|nr:hypothetical protein UFOVP35_15 [uncultured Caudovirales phage]CAB4124522.1 hypothetical protein UFOVP52_32 [uncultured Caudovirales phage]CAB5219875.1 hypothetical protein UFOVP234_57 [uncultured Caudovirales phage]